MKLHSDRSATGHRITAYGPGFVTIDDERLPGNVVVSPEALIRDWDPGAPAAVSAEALTAIVESLEVEIVLIGTGRTQSFPAAEVYRACTGRGVGLEVMSTPAACRTYNILLGEGRRIAACLLEIRT